ncbi:MAG: RagB/SusD family nutrient uptake outer membrane protein [Chlorobi bacterium]|nr:RagB/SusD family nutrient uptake outer membrane protein [Chlorobiota bacterium]
MKKTDMMKKVYNIILIFLVGTLFFSCENFLTPEEDNRLTEEQMLQNPGYWEGLLLEAYGRMPRNYKFDLDIAGDDAVTNDVNSSATRMATGEWTSAYNPVSQWNSAYAGIFYVNNFLEKYREVTWSWESDKVNELHLQRLSGEAYGLRAWYEILLMVNHAGAVNGQITGLPVVDKVLGIDDFQVPRATIENYLKQINADLDSAIINLPAYYEDVADDADYNEAMGTRFINRLSGTAARALKSRVSLLAASPSYSVMTWEEAAAAAGELIRDNGGLTILSPTGVEFYKDFNDRENIWFTAFTMSRSLESDNFPPSLYGKGLVNPTQELVNSFPMVNGYPITDPASGYDLDNPYANRDPRLTKYIVYNENTLKGDNIYTYVGSGDDGINALVSSTRSGYYLKKFMNESVTLTPGREKSAQFFRTYIRWSEVLLNYAEAANEAWGPDADPNSYGFSARDVIAALRSRAGITGGDAYLATITSKDEMRELIHNERRIELCFENFRFWDIRRWEKTDVMKSPVSAVFIYPNAGGGYSYDVQKAEDRIYEDYMIYGPIPYNETLKYDIPQNDGW